MLEHVTLSSFSFDDLEVDLFGDAAVVRARYRQQAAVDGHDWSDEFVFTDVWIRRNDRWVAVARHSSQPPKREFTDLG